jgi:hypothetical protein
MSGLEKTDPFVVGAIVLLYPGDTYAKYARIIRIHGNGIVFQHTEGTDNRCGYDVGDYHYISHSKNLDMKFIK